MSGVLLIALRLFNVQVLDNYQYSNMVDKQSIRREISFPKRGEIRDRNNLPLVVNAKLEVEFNAKKSPKKKMNKKLKRVALNHFLASQVLGTVGYENDGQFGLEYQYNRTLKGIKGWKQYRLNASRKLFPSDDEKQENSINGKHLVTTIDQHIQKIAEAELRKGVEKVDAIDGVAMIMDPHTGEILALANYPFFHLNRKSKEDTPYWKNQGISKVYEPGSTMKIFTTAIALEEKLVNEKERIDVEGGEFLIDGVVVYDTKEEKNVNLEQAIAYSSNIAMVKIADRMSNETFYSYLRSFGFGNKTGINLPGEEKGFLKKVNQWSGRSKITMSWGQEISATPLQLLIAASVIANGGILLKPKIIKGYINSLGEWEEEKSSSFVRRVIDEETTKRLRKLLASVVQYGTASNIATPYYSIAGKTGTVEKIDSTGNYVSGKFHSSFIGMVPAENPKYIGIILINEPQKNKYGGVSAAPVFRNIMDQMLRIPQYALGKPKLNKKEKTNFKLSQPVKLAQANLFDYRIESSQKNNSLQENEENFQKMPNLVGLSLKEAMKKIKPLSSNFSYQGSGIVTSQKPKVNTIIDSQAHYHLVLK